MRTVLNALVKCLFSIGFIAVHFCHRIVVSKIRKSEVNKDVEKISVNNPEEEKDQIPPVTSDPRVSLLGPLPHYYGSSSKTESTKTKYV